MTSIPKAYMYIRMSTELQSKGDSKRRQEEAQIAYAKAHNLDIQLDQIYFDKGISAYQGKNIQSGALGQFLADARNGKISTDSYLLVESLDRISRQGATQALGTFLSILDCKINIVTLMDKQIYFHGNVDANQLLFSIIIMSRAHDESRARSERIGSSWKQKRKNIHLQKMTANCPLWLSIDDKRSEFKIIKERADIIKGIFQSCVDGQGIYATARQMNQKLVPPFGRGIGWHTSTINKILSNRAVLGEFQPHKFSKGKRVPDGEVISDYFPKIIEEATFIRAQAARKTRLIGGRGRKGQNISNLFSGLVKCGHCEANLYFKNRGSGPKGGNYLVCSSADRGLNCPFRPWAYEEFENLFLSYLQELDLSSIIEEDSSASKALELLQDIEKIKWHLVDIEIKRDNLIEFIAENGNKDSSISPRLANYIDSLNEKRKQYENLQIQYNDLNATQMSIRENIEIKALIENLNNDDEKKFQRRSKISARIKSIIDEIYAFHKMDIINKRQKYINVYFKNNTSRIIIPNNHDTYQSDTNILVETDRLTIGRGNTAKTVKIVPNGIMDIIKRIKK